MSYNIADYQNINPLCCCFSLRKVTRAVTQLYDRYLEPAGIRATQFTLLIELSAASGKTLTEMAERLVMDRTTLTRNLKPLEKAQFITTVKLSDRRSKGYTLTEKGREAIEKGLPLWRKAQEFLMTKIGADRYRRFLDELKSVQTMASTTKSSTSHL